MAETPLEDRTDRVPKKVQLLSAAYNQGDYDLAMSLAESIKDTLTRDRFVVRKPDPPQISGEHFTPVAELPQAWADWARGWSFVKTLALFETVGIPRSGEPVEVAVAFRDDQTRDLAREVRVARLNPATGSLAEIPSQVYGELYHDGQRHVRLVFAADVPMHGQASYFIFYGNPHAELPRYASDLKTRGEGFGLDVENRHFVASLSRQMGQLERLALRRAHGLELFAGGKGHGEPPTVDWSGDYVDPGHFQKLRMRCWAECPNFEVVTGPLCVRVRRWGFPHSPIHPLFAPSRMHMDQTYVFYAGLPYFFKEGRCEMVQDFEVNAMRDDEWVFSGYSFTNQVWIDQQGKLHEGRAPSDGVWGVGFYHDKSRDAFIALWLDHAGENVDKVAHNGFPTLNYRSHGQIWSRYPTREAKFKAGSAIRQRNAYVISAFPKAGGAEQIERLRHRLRHPTEARPERIPKVRAAKASGQLARIGETEATAPLKPAVWRALGEVRDEQLYNVKTGIVDLGYVYDLQVRAGVVRVTLTMPHRGRPVYSFLITQGGGRVDEGIRERVLRIPGVRDVVVEFTWQPAWSPARLSPAARKELGLA